MSACNPEYFQGNALMQIPLLHRQRHDKPAQEQKYQRMCVMTRRLFDIEYTQQREKNDG
jgi:hypothetical protein